jgi:hypothetical protein
MPCPQHAAKTIAIASDIASAIEHIHALVLAAERYPT